MRYVVYWIVGNISYIVGYCQGIVDALFNVNNPWE